jgi:alcohol dehydrogenase (NADP+)
MAGYDFEGWCGLGPEATNGKMVWQGYTPKPFTDDDVDIHISHTGVCGTDLHTLRSGFYPTPYPCVVGHEIIGKAVRVGANVKHVGVGDRVGVGAQAASCLKSDCQRCADSYENHCPQAVYTYGSLYPDGSKSYGGFANYNRTPGHFVFKIPDRVPSVHAAPILCAGITMYSPLKLYGCGPGKRIGIVGLGGLGHFGVLFAKSLGASKIVAISRTHAKEEDAHKLGAEGFIATTDKGWDEGEYANSLDIIISTVSSEDIPLTGYLNLLAFRGTFVQVGAPEDALPKIGAFSLITKAVKVTGSAIGSPREIEEMLQLVAETGLQPWTQEIPMKGANQAIIDFEAGKPRYRFVLVNENYKD